jgi:hypothetical protein
VPAVTRVYDPVLGISPQPLTEELLTQTAELRQLLALDPASPAVQQRVPEVRRLTLRVLRDDPFQRSGQERTLEVFRLVIFPETGQAPFDLTAPVAVAQAVAEFWSEDPAVLGQRLDLFDARLRTLLRNNYFRAVNLDGRLVDHFWRIDLPFLSLFLLEFCVRWGRSVRRREHARWYFFPIFNWYDLIGLVPYTQFRIFRLLRVASIYMRLHRSELSRVGKGVLARAVAYVSSIIAEEISDAVALRILRETQDEIREGTARRIVNQTLGERRDQIEATVVTQIREIVRDEATQERIRTLLRVNLEAAAEKSTALGSVPLPAAVMRPIVRATGEVILNTTLQSLVATLDSDKGERAAREVVGGILDQVLSGPWRAEIDELSSSITLDVIEQMKQAVTVRKWALPGRADEVIEPDDVELQAPGNPKNRD